jgi:hypothetical protein
MIVARTVALVALLTLCSSANAQCLDSLGLNDAPMLNRCEAEVFRKLYCTWPHLPADSLPRVSFHYGNSAKTVAKTAFFQRFVTPWLRRNGEPSVQWYLLAPADRTAAGVDGIAVAWSKVLLSKRRYDRIVKRLARERITQ